MESSAVVVGAAVAMVSALLTKWYDGRISDRKLATEKEHRDDEAARARQHKLDDLKEELSRREVELKEERARKEQEERLQMYADFNAAILHLMRALAMVSDGATEQEANMASINANLDVQMSKVMMRGHPDVCVLASKVLVFATLNIGKSLPFDLMKELATLQAELSATMRRHASGVEVFPSIVLSMPAKDAHEATKTDDGAPAELT